MNYDNFIASEKLFDAIEDRNPKKVQELINSGCDVNRSYSEDGITPLMYAATIGDLEIVKLLVQSGADVNAKSAHGSSALFDAAFSEHQEVLKYLKPLTNIRTQLAVKRYIKTGKNYPPRAYEMVDTFTEEALFGNLEAVSFILSTGININAVDSSDRTALLAAIRNKKDDVVQFLLKAGADPNIKEQDERGRTPLIAALEQGSEIAFQMLLEAGADINESSNYGETALMSAVWVTDLAAVRKLLQMGADTKLKDEYGRTALDRARMFVEQFPEDAKAKEILQLLGRADS